MNSRYSRQTVLPEVGVAGQLRLRETSVLCVGAGGLGAPVLQYLAAAGIGRIGIMDPDRVDESNLQRQVLFGASDLGRLKAEAAAARLKDLNAEIEVDILSYRLDASNALAVLGRYDIIVDGTDNFTAKFLINDAAVKLGLPVVFGAISGLEGQVCVFWAKHGACYRCLYPRPPVSHIANCAEAGALGAVAGVVGSLQASEVLRLALMPKSETPAGISRLVLLDAWKLDFRVIEIPRSSRCFTCACTPEAIVLEEEAPSCVARAGSRTGFAPSESMWIDVREHEEWVQSHVPHALSWPLSQLKVGRYPTGLRKEGPYILYCQTGNRSGVALRILEDAGFMNGHELPGGLSAWNDPIAFAKPD